VTGFAIFAITLPRAFAFVWDKLLLSANAYFASGCHGEKAKTKV
jgi:hypothetical protein